MAQGCRFMAWELLLVTLSSLAQLVNRCRLGVRAPVRHREDAEEVQEHDSRLAAPLVLGIIVTWLL